MMLLILAIFIAFAVAVSVFAVEYSDRMNRKCRAQDMDYLRGSIEQAQRQHKPRRHLWKQLVEARRKELAQ